jgi:outer membrane protein TolC
MMLLLLGGFAAPTAAQTPRKAQPDTIRLTPDEAVSRALDQGVDVRLARAAVLTPQTGKCARRPLAALPQITTSLTYTRQFASIYSGLGGGSGFDTCSRTHRSGRPMPESAAPGVAAPLVGGKVVRRARRRSRTARSLRWRQAETTADVTFQVKQAYYNAALQGRLLTIAVENPEQAQQHLHEVQLYQQAGTRAEYDLLRAQVDAANQEPAVVAAKMATTLPGSS